MKLVISYSVPGDWGAMHDVVVCLEYESTEAFLVEFEDAILDADEAEKSDLKFADHTWEVADFIIKKRARPGRDGAVINLRQIEVHELNEWFEANRV